ncbi:MAG: DUF4374 domain-containing protein [Myxococcota bacterium]
MTRHAILAFLLLAAACGDDASASDSDAGTDLGAPDAASDLGMDEGAPPPDFAALVTVTILPTGGRTTYLQAIDLNTPGPFGTEDAIENFGNAVSIGGDGRVFIGLAEEPVWVRYELDADAGQLVETGRLSLAPTGARRIAFGNAYVDATMAVTVVPELAIAVVWNPTTMTIEREIEMPHLEVRGFTAETFTTVAHEGLVYVPGRWGNLALGRIVPGVSTAILDPAAGRVLGVAEDERCTSGGQVVFDDEGYAYVMGDGRTHLTHVIAYVRGEPALDNCILRIPPGGTDFDPDFYVAIPSLTDGLQSITELNTGSQGSGVGFAKMFYPDQLPEGVEPTGFEYWNEPAHRLWRLELGETVTAAPVEGLPFGQVGFGSYPYEGQLMIGETSDGATSEVYAVDPETNEATRRFTMTGFFTGLYALDGDDE